MDRLEAPDDGTSRGERVRRFGRPVAGMVPNLGWVSVSTGALSTRTAEIMAKVPFEEG